MRRSLNPSVRQLLMYKIGNFFTPSEINVIANLPKQKKNDKGPQNVR